MARVADKGDLYIHQDANWNVIAVTDLGGQLVERYVYTPYGELTVHQVTSFGDRDGDGDVDSTDKGTAGVDCTGTVSGACRILDLDFDGDYDSNDATLFDSLPQGVARHPALSSTGVDQPFGYKGLAYQPETRFHQNRAREYSPTFRRFPQRDPLHEQHAVSAYEYVRACPTSAADPSGRIPYFPDNVDESPANINFRFDVALWSTDTISRCETMYRVRYQLWYTYSARLLWEGITGRFGGLEGTTMGLTSDNFHCKPTGFIYDTEYWNEQPDLSDRDIELQLYSHVDCAFNPTGGMHNGSGVGYLCANAFDPMAFHLPAHEVGHALTEGPHCHNPIFSGFSHNEHHIMFANDQYQRDNRYVSVHTMFIIESNASNILVEDYLPCELP